MNNKGEVGLKEAFLFIAIMCLCILITMVMYNRNVKDLFGGSSSSKETYQNTEHEITEAAKNYVDNHYDNQLEIGDSDYVTIKTLISAGLIDEVIDPKNKKTTCTGYVNFYKKGIDITYEPYIKCGLNYHTKGYNANYDA